MKKAFLYFFVLLLFPILVIPVFAVVPTILPEPTPIAYVLPYPGILPTHPLYVFKNFRDTIIEFLITDALHKAEFHILQADKKLNMGITLKEIKKDQDAMRAFTDSFRLRVLAVTFLEDYEKGSKTIPGHIKEKLLLSIAKHEEVLTHVGANIKDIHALYLRAKQLGSSE